MTKIMQKIGNVICGLVLLALSGCATGEVSVVKMDAVAIDQPGARIAVVSYASTLVKSFALNIYNNCFFDQLDSGEGFAFEKVPINVYEEITNDDAIGSYLRGAGPLDFVLLKEHPVIRDKITAQGYRYLILTSFAHFKLKNIDSVDCGAALGAAGCGGVDSWTNNAYMHAVLLDLDTEKLLVEFHADYTSDSWILWLGLPVAGAFDTSGTKACKELGQAVSGYLQQSGSF